MSDRIKSGAAFIAWLSIACGCSTMAAQAPEYPVAWHDGLGMDAEPVPGPDDWAAWMAKPWQIEGEPVKSILRNSDGEEVEVRTCEELFNSEARGWTAGYVEGRIHSARAAKCHAARIVAGAAPAAHSYVQGFSLDEASVRELPVSLAAIISPDDVRRVNELQATGGTLGNYLRDSVIVTDSDGTAWIKDDWGGGQSLRIEATGDFNKDGIADLLVSSSSWVDIGSHWSQGLWIITRDAFGAPLRVVEEIPVMAL